MLIVSGDGFITLGEGDNGHKRALIKYENRVSKWYRIQQRYQHITKFSLLQLNITASKTKPMTFREAQPAVSVGHLDSQLVLNAIIPIYNEMYSDPLHLTGVPLSPKSIWIKTLDQTTFRKAFPNATYANVTASCNETNTVSS